MGSSSPTDSKDKKKIEYYNENGIIHNPEPKQISTIPIPLLLLSLIKIKEIKTFLQENRENIETNGKVKLLKILCDLNKSTKLINDYVNKFNKEFSENIRDLSGLFLYDFVLNQLYSELQNFENKIGNISLKELFYFNITATCGKCKNCKNNDFILMLNTDMLITEKIEMDLFCKNCKNKTDHLIKINNKPKIIISINEDLQNNRTFEMMMKNQYESICQIYSKSLLYKNFKNCYQYDLDSNTYKKAIKSENKSIVYIYRELTNNIDSENNLNNQNNKNNQAIMSFIMNKNYSQAIMNYLMIKKNNFIRGKMFLVNKEYFDYLLIMNDIDTTNIDSNNFMMLGEKIQSNKLEIMNMNKLIIYDEPEKIIGDVDFVTEEILKNLGFKANEYFNKDVQVIKNDQNQLYQILSHNKSIIKLIIQGNQQKIYLLDKLAIQTLGYLNQNQNINNANQQREIQAKMINDNQNNNINNVNNVNNVDSKEDKKEKELKDKMVLIYSSIAKLFIDIDSIKNLINSHIVDENKFEEYLVISKRIYNLITKIFESNDVYQNENIVFSSISHMSNIPTLQKNDLIQIYNLFENRKNLLKKENLLNLDCGSTKTDEEIIAYPKNFILIKEKNLEELLSKLNIKIKPVNQIYKMILGEGYAFIKDNKTKKNIIFVCKNDNNMVFNVEFLLQYDKDDEFTKEIKKIIKNKGFENYFKERNINLNKKSQDLINKELEKIGKFEIILNSNPLLRGLFYSLSNIKNINSYFKPLNNQANVLSYLFSSYIKNNNQNLIQMNKIILETEEKLKELSNQSLNTFNFKTLIKFILNTLDNELNKKRRDINNINIEGYDQSFALNKFKELVNKQNDSIIYKLFCGTIKITRKFQSCQIENYSHKLFKYLHFKIEKGSPTDINALIESYKSKDKKGKGDCDNCAKKGEDYIKHKEILIYPEILIIILDNENNINIDTKLSLKLKDEDFILISCITKSDNIDDYNIIYQEKLKYFIYDGNEKKEVGQELSDYIKNPFVLFYKKQKKDDPSCIMEKDEEYEEDIHDSVPTFLKNQMDENNENNIDNNINNDNSITKMMIQKSFNENQMNNIKTSIHDTKIIQNGDNQNFNNNNMNNMNVNENNMNNMIINNNLPNNMNNNMDKNQNIHKSLNLPKTNNEMNWNNNMNPMDMNNVNQKKISQSMNQFNMPNFNKQMNSQNNNQMNLFNNMNSNNQMNNANMNQFNNINPQMNGNNMNNNMMNPNNMNNMMNPNNMNNMINNNNMNNMINNNMNNMMNNNNMNNMMNNMNNNNWNNKMNNINNNNMNNFNNNNMNNMNNFNNNMNNMNIISNNNMNNNMMNNNFKNNMNFNNNWNNNMMNQFNQNVFNRFNNNNNPMIMNNNMQNNNAFQLNNNQNRFVNQNNNNQMLNNNQQINPNNFAQNQNQRPMPVSNPINNQNNQDNNINMNINNSANNQMMDNDSESENQNDNILSKNEGEITIYFDFKNGKQIYIDVNVKTIFREVINQLKEKYEWLNNINIKYFLYNGRTVDINKTCEENNIAESAKISIIDE